MRESGIHPVPYWRLSSFYFFYFAALGAFLPYWALYLQAIGYEPADIGLLIAVFPASKIVSPSLWGWLADRSGRSVMLIRIASWLTAVSFAMIFGVSGFWSMGAVSLLIGFFWNAPLPLFEAVTLSHLRQQPNRYSRIRLWGSVGFIVAVVFLGDALDRWLAIDCLPQVILVLFAAMSVVPFLLRECSVSGHGGSGGSFRSILSSPVVIAFLSVFLLIQMAHGPYYTFFSVYLKDSGYTSSQTGMLWTLGVIAEILLFLLLDRILIRFRLRHLLMAAALLGALRWFLIAWYIHELWLVVLAQLFHAATFGVSHVAAIQLVHRHFSGPHQGKGQALYSSLSYGIGGMIGSYLSGLGWSLLGPEIIFSLAGVTSAVAFLIVWAGVDKTVPRSVAEGMG